MSDKKLVWQSFRWITDLKEGGHKETGNFPTLPSDTVAEDVQINTV